MWCCFVVMCYLVVGFFECIWEICVNLLVYDVSYVVLVEVLNCVFVIVDLWFSDIG